MGKLKTEGLKEVANEVIGLEYNKIIATIKYLTIKPSYVITEYCGGEKKKFLSPVVYFLGVEAISLSLFSISGLSDFLLNRNIRNVIGLFNSRFPSLATPKNETESMVHNLGGFYSFFFTQYGRELIGLPILILLTWLFYKRFNKSFKENSWFALYIWGHASLLSAPVILTFYVTKDLTLFGPLTFLITVLYWTWASTKFYKLKLARALTLRVLMYISYVLVLSITSTIFSGIIRLFTN